MTLYRALPGLVRLTIGLRLGPRIVAPVPLDASAVKLFVIVSATLKIGRQNHPRRGEAIMGETLTVMLGFSFLSGPAACADAATASPHKIAGNRRRRRLRCMSTSGKR